MKYLAAFTALSLLASTAAYAQSTQPQSQNGASHEPSAQSQSEATSEQQPQLSQKFIRQIQRRLQQQGMYQETPSGTWDQATSDALEQFQEEHGLQANGEIDGATLMALMRPQRMQQQGMQDGMEGSSSGSSTANGRSGFRAYQRGYQEGFAQGFSTAIQEAQQQKE